MIRTSIYDRISEQRLKAEALALEQAEQEVVETEAPEPLSLTPPTPLQEAASSFNFAGLNFAFPQGLAFSDIKAIAHVNGEQIDVSIQRRAVAEQHTLVQGFGVAVEELQALYPQLRIIRQREGVLAGNAALITDFIFRAGHEERHGRLAGALMPVADSNERQWLSVSCVIDPQKPALQGWLLDFDDMLAGLATR